MITSSNFFNKNLFLPDDDEQNADKLEEGQWMPVKSEKVYPLMDIHRQQQGLEKSIEGKNNFLPSIDHANRLKKQEDHSQQCNAQQVYFTHRSSLTNYYNKDLKSKKALKAIKFQYLPLNPSRYSQQMQPSSQEQQHSNTLAAFLNTRKLQRLQKYRTHDIQPHNAQIKTKYLPKQIKLSNHNNIFSQMKHFVSPRNMQGRQKSIELSELKLSRNYSPLANELNFIMRSKGKSEKNVYLGKHKGKNNLNFLSNSPRYGKKTKNYQTINHYSLQSNNSRVINMKI